MDGKDKVKTESKAIINMKRGWEKGEEIRIGGKIYEKEKEED